MDTPYKIVMVDDILYLSDIEKEIIASIGCSVEQYHCFEPEEILSVARDADAIMTVSGHFTAEVIDQLEKCKIIARYGCGYDNVDTEAATRKGIVVTYVPIYCQVEVATLAVTLMLACERRILLADRAVRSGDWLNSVRAVDGARSVGGRTFGMLGFGKIARKTAQLIKAFGTKLIAYDPYADETIADDLGVELVDFDTFITTSDYISIHCPLTSETWHMLDKEQFDKMKPGVIIINTGRGAVMNQAELVEALKDGRVAAAGLDVLDPEPPGIDEELYKLDNVILSGHTAAATEQAVNRLRRSVANSVVSVLSGKKPKTAANPQVFDRLNLE